MASAFSSRRGDSGHSPPAGMGRCQLTDVRYEERTLKNGFRSALAVLLYAGERKPFPQFATKTGIKRMPASTPGARGGAGAWPEKQP